MPTILTKEQKANVGKIKMTVKQELFCRLYASDTEFFGNGTESYIKAFRCKNTPKMHKHAAESACRLLLYPHVLNRINELLDERGLNDQNVDKQLLFLITQHKDFQSKLGAIKEYNKLKDRINEKLRLANEDGSPLTIKVISYKE